MAGILSIRHLLEPDFSAGVDDGNDQLAGPRFVGVFCKSVLAQSVCIAGDHSRVGDSGLAEGERERRRPDLLAVFRDAIFAAIATVDVARIDKQRYAPDGDLYVAGLNVGDGAMLAAKVPTLASMATDTKTAKRTETRGKQFIATGLLGQMGDAEFFMAARICVAPVAYRRTGPTRGRLEVSRDNNTSRRAP